MYLLDTNTLIYYFKGKGKVAMCLLQVAPREVAVSAVTVYEYHCPWRVVRTLRSDVEPCSLVVPSRPPRQSRHVCG